MTKEQLDKELENALMKDDETRERLKGLKKKELDDELDQFAANAHNEEKEAPAEVAKAEADA